MIVHVMLAMQLTAAAPPAADTVLFPPRETVMRLYTDCDEDRWPWGTEEVFVPKTPDEITSGVARRRATEALWRDYWTSRGGDTLPATPDSGWVYPLAVRGRLLDNFRNPRQGGLHGALDIFVTREGVVIRAPVTGLVVAAGDDWQGGYTRRRGFFYLGGGLSRRSGNGVMLWDPYSGAYLLFSHLQPGVRVATGDLVRAGQPLGRVGHTGNASYPGRGRHLHFAYKKPGTGCGFDSVLVSVNPYPLIRAARARMR